MIKRFVAGNPLETEAVLKEVRISEEKIPYLTVTQQGFACKLEPEDIVYGLGENVRGINKRGWLYESNCTDNPFHQEDTRSLYGAHNFLIVCGKERCFGVFLDTPANVTFDIGYTHLDEMEITLAEPDYELYVLEGETPEKIVGNSVL